jgi:hypothetical protein
MSRTPLFLLVLALVTLAACSSDAGESNSTIPSSESAAATTVSAGSTQDTQTTEATATQTTTAAPSAGLDIDPCSLLTTAEITAATGVEFGEGAINDAMTNEDQAVCDWISTGSEFATAQVLIVNSDVFDSNMSSAEEVFGLTTEPVDVPGSDRTYATAEGSVVAMQIGGVFVQVAYIPSGPGDVLDATLELATIAAGRIP